MISWIDKTQGGGKQVSDLTNEQFIEWWITNKGPGRLSDLGIPRTQHAHLDMQDILQEVAMRFLGYRDRQIENRDALASSIAINLVNDIHRSLARRKTQCVDDIPELADEANYSEDLIARAAEAKVAVKILLHALPGRASEVVGILLEETMVEKRQAVPRTALRLLESEGNAAPTHVEVTAKAHAVRAYCSSFVRAAQEADARSELPIWLREPQTTEHLHTWGGAERRTARHHSGTPETVCSVVIPYEEDSGVTVASVGFGFTICSNVCQVLEVRPPDLPPPNRPLRSRMLLRFLALEDLEEKADPDQAAASDAVPTTGEAEVTGC